MTIFSRLNQVVSFLSIASKPVYLMGLYLILSSTSVLVGQSVSSSLPKKIVRSEKYLFYLHGQVITDLGDHAINPGAPEWGPYEYTSILDSLRNRGFNVISEIRKKGIADSVYVNKLSGQIDTLVKAGIQFRNLVVVGASSGWGIALGVSSRQRKNGLNFVMMGGCWPNTYKSYFALELPGNFLSIIEKTDPHGSCSKIFEGKKHPEQYKEVILNTGLSHGFFYKGREEWMNPITEWLKSVKR